MPEVPPPSTFSVDLAWEKSHGTEDARRKRHQPFVFWIDTHTRWRLNLLPRVQPVDVLNKADLSGPVIDLGCGSGGFTKTLATRFTPYGIEISRHLATEADTRFREHGGHCHHGPAAAGLDSFPDGFFAGALLRSYLEHDAEARQVLFALRRKIRPGGLTVVRVPNYGSLNRYVMGRNWCGFRFPDHCNYFTRSSLVELAGQAGFTVHFPRLFNLPTDDNMLAVLRV